jgi:mannose-6-phosphate isomerase-like protein (cupin superfamily)
VDVIDTGGARRFSRERPNRFVLLDRPRLTCDLVCLEPGQREDPRENSSSDELYYVIEGQATLRVGVHEYRVGAQQALLVPPQMEHWIANTGPGRLTALAIVTPKPGREAEVRPRRPAGPARARQAAGERPRRPPAQGQRGAEVGRKPAASGREREAPRRTGRAAAPHPSRGPRPGARGRPSEPPSGGPDWPGPAPRARARRGPKASPAGRPTRGRGGQRQGGPPRPSTPQPGKGAARRQRRS